MAFRTIARRMFFPPLIPPESCNMCFCLCFGFQGIVRKFTLGHFLTVIIIIYNVVFVGGGNRTNSTFEIVYGAMGPVDKEYAPYFGAYVFAHSIKLASFVCRWRLHCTLL